MEITFISDTHNIHNELNEDLVGGPLLIHCGDVSGRGSKREIDEFIDWFSSLPYTHKIFIAGNHDFLFERENIKESIRLPKGVHYLHDSHIIIEGIKIYGTPWQPWFYDWAFNLPRNGTELKEKFDLIPKDTDILISHTPPSGILDLVTRGYNVGCEALKNRILEINPKINCFGHIHEAYGHEFINGTHYINASSLDQRYRYSNKPIILKYENI